MLTVDDVVYDPVTHTSSLPGGIKVPHVTEVLSALGISTDFDELAAGSSQRAQAIVNASARGTAVHADCHAYDDNDLDLDDVDARVLPYVRAWIEMRRDVGLVPVARERRLFHAVDRYTGIMDGVFAHDGRLVLGDLKTGDPENAAAHLQTAAYERAWSSEHPYPERQIAERWAIWLRPDRRVPYTIINYTAHPEGEYDIEKWLACLTAYREQPGRRRRRT